MKTIITIVLLIAAAIICYVVYEVRHAIDLPDDYEFKSQDNTKTAVPSTETKTSKEIRK